MLKKALILSLLASVPIVGGGAFLSVDDAAGDKPACSAGERLTVALVKAADGSDDTVPLCVRDNDGSYAWADLAVVTATATPVTWPAVTGGTCASIAFTWTGTEAGDMIYLNVASNMGATVNGPRCYSGADTVSLALCATTGGYPGGTISHRFERRIR